MSYQEKMKVWFAYFIGDRPLDKGFLELSSSLIRENFYQVFVDGATLLGTAIFIWIFCVLSFIALD